MSMKSIAVGAALLTVAAGPALAESCGHDVSCGADGQCTICWDTKDGVECAEDSIGFVADFIPACLGLPRDGVVETAIPLVPFRQFELPDTRIPALEIVTPTPVPAVPDVSYGG